MNDIMYLYFDFDQKDQQAVDAIENCCRAWTRF